MQQPAALQAQGHIVTPSARALDVEQAIGNKFPGIFDRYPTIVTSAVSGFLRYLLHEDDINRFLAENSELDAYEFIEAVLRYFNASYTVPNTEREHIPSCGRAVLYCMFIV